MPRASRRTVGSWTSSCSGTADRDGDREASGGVVERPVPPPDEEQSDDLGGVPDDGGRVGEEEVAVAVEDAEAPCRHHEEADADRHDLGEVHGELEDLAGEPGGEDRRDRPRGDDEEQHREIR